MFKFTSLCGHFLREAERGVSLPDGVTHSVGEATLPGPWWTPLGECDAAINLAGHPIFTRWTAPVKSLIRESRLATTRNLVAALPRDRPFTLLSASGIGVYGDSGERELDEEAPLGRDFLAAVAREWEQEAAGKCSGEEEFLIYDLRKTADLR